MYKIGRSILARCICLNTLKYCRDKQSSFIYDQNKSKIIPVSRTFNTEENLILTLDRVYSNKDDFNNTSLFNFIQGSLGNCGMVSSISLLANNKYLYEKVIPKGQDFDIKNPSKVMFHLYKLGELHKVIVDKKLLYDGNELKYCRSINSNLIGPLLEKALVFLHFDGNYESAKSVPASFILSSLTNNFFETFYFHTNKNCLDINKLISCGLKSKSLMVVTFKDKRALKLNLRNHHFYSLVNVEKSKTNSIKLYNPHGEIVSIPEKDFVETRKVFEICYSENKIFGIPEIKTLIELKDNWPLLKMSNEKTHFAEYDLLINEDETEILINLILKKFSTKIKPIILIIKSNNEMEIVNSSLSIHKFDNVDTFYHRYSLRENLNRGKYKIRVVISKLGEIESCQECRKYLENGGDEFLIRIAASKHCSVKKSVKKEKNEKNC